MTVVALSALTAHTYELYVHTYECYVQDTDLTKWLFFSPTTDICVPIYALDLITKNL